MSNCPCFYAVAGSQWSVAGSRLRSAVRGLRSFSRRSPIVGWSSVIVVLALSLMGCGTHSGVLETAPGSIPQNNNQGTNNTIPGGLLSGTTISAVGVQSNAQGVTVTATITGTPPAAVQAVVTDSTANQTGSTPLSFTSGATWMGTVTSVVPAASDSLAITVFATDINGNIVAKIGRAHV